MIIPYEHALSVNFGNYEQGAVVRVTVPQALDLLAADAFVDDDGALRVRLGAELLPAFVLYRSADDLEHLPPDPGWRPCEHVVDSKPSARRTALGTDVGHFLVRIPKQTAVGIAQGIFAPEYAPHDVNYRCQLLLTSLAYRSIGHPSDGNAEHIEIALAHLGLMETDRWSSDGLLSVEGYTACPLCMRPIEADELHETIDPSQVPGLANSGVQLAETRSTLINLFHLRPLLYSRELGHEPRNVAWGHAHCNTFLAQRRSWSLAALRASGTQPAIEIHWDPDELFIRAADGRAWVSVTPIPPGRESFTEFLTRAGARDALDEEPADLEEDLDHELGDGE